MFPPKAKRRIVLYFMGYLKREALFKKFFLVSDWANKAVSALHALALFAFAVTTVIFCCLLIYDIGFRTSEMYSGTIHLAYIHLLSIFFAAKFGMELFQFRQAAWRSFVFKIFLLFIIFLVITTSTGSLHLLSPGLTKLASNKFALIICSIILIVSEVYRISEYLSSIDVSASLLFAGSFLFMIFVGSGLLMLPNATVRPISYLEALFTATSAVCITGLTVVDTSTTFTPLGKGVILVLIQLGGLGIMTFTGFFTYLFQGSATLRDRFLLKEIFSEEHLGGLHKLLFKILFITVLVEVAGAILIYYSLDGTWANKMHFSVFHAVSAFCNAGFSLFPQGLYTESVRHNYPLQLTICALILLGSIGFPVLLTFYKFLKRLAIVLIRAITHWKKEVQTVAMSIGERLALWTSLILLVSGAVFYYLFEMSGSLQNTAPAGQMIAAFFGSVSARSAGFNIVDLSLWSYPTVFLIIFLMWIGSSPGSTGGGIKTTSLALAVMTVFNFCRGKKHLEIGNREIGGGTFIRVLSVIVLSIAIIFFAFMILMVLNPAKNPAHLLFECVSAFSTTGLSLVNTPTLDVYSQFVLIILMFAGRIGPVVLLSGLLLTKRKETYRLPVEDISMN